MAAVEACRVEYFVANGISDNRYQYLDVSTTRPAIRYRPPDDAWA